MEKIRKGNSFNIMWEIVTGVPGHEHPYDLTGKNLDLYLCGPYKKEKIDEFAIEGNTIAWTYEGKNQKHYGVYGLVLVENEGEDDMHTVDECKAFELVNNSILAGGDKESHIELKQVRLRSRVSLNSIVIDSELSTTSENPVMNRVVTNVLNKKQDSILDLDIIREGASKGATALQDIPSQYITKIDLDNAIPKKLSDLEIDIEVGGDSPIVEGEVENSAIFNGEVKYLGQTYKNRAVSQTSIALGGNTLSGLRGYYITYIDFETGEIWLHDSRTEIAGVGIKIDWKQYESTETNKCLYKGGRDSDQVSIICNGRHYKCGRIQTQSGNTLYLDRELPFTQEDVNEVRGTTGIVGINKFDELTLFVIDKPDIGPVDLGGTSLAEGLDTKAISGASHAEGYQTTAYGKYSHTEGYQTEAGYRAHAEGYMSKATGENSHTEGRENESIGNCSHSEGKENKAYGTNSHVEGDNTTTGVKGNADKGSSAHAEGHFTNALGNYSHAEGFETSAEGEFSHAEGKETVAVLHACHAEGYKTHAEGSISHAEGEESYAIGESSHSEGYKTKAEGTYSHAQNEDTHAKGVSSHAEGYQTYAEGNQAHAEGDNTKAVGHNSHSEGKGTIALGENSHAEGQYNVSSKDIIHCVGIGASVNNRKNAHSITKDGKHYVYGIGGYDGKSISTAQDLATVIGAFGGNGGKFSFREFTQREIPPIRIDIDSIPDGEYISFDEFGITEDQEEYMNLIALTRFSDGGDYEVAYELFNVIGDFSVYAIVSRTNIMLECIQYDESGDEINSTYVYLDLKNRIVYSS